MATLGIKLDVDLKNRFKSYCSGKGKTINFVLINFIKKELGDNDE